MGLRSLYNYRSSHSDIKIGPRAERVKQNLKYVVVNNGRSKKPRMMMDRIDTLLQKSDCCINQLDNLSLTYVPSYRREHRWATGYLKWGPRNNHPVSPYRACWARCRSAQRRRFKGHKSVRNYGNQLSTWPWMNEWMNEWGSRPLLCTYIS